MLPGSHAVHMPSLTLNSVILSFSWRMTLTFIKLSIITWSNACFDSLLQVCAGERSNFLAMGYSMADIRCWGSKAKHPGHESKTSWLIEYWLHAIRQFEENPSPFQLVQPVFLLVKPLKRNGCVASIVFVSSFSYALLLRHVNVSRHWQHPFR